MVRPRANRLGVAAWLIGFTCALGGAAPIASAAVINFDEQPASTVLGEQYAAGGVHIGTSPFPDQSGALTVVAKPGLARSGSNVAALNYDLQTDFSSSWIRFDKPQSKVSFYACRDGGGGDPPQPNINVDAYDASGVQIDNQQGIPCNLNGPLVPITVQKPGVTFIHVAGTGGSAPPGQGWAIDDLEYETDPPPYVPPPVVTPPVVTPPATNPLLITGMGAAAPVVAGRPALLSAAVVGQPQRLEWDVTGDGKTDVSCPGNQTTLGFSAGSALATNAVTVKAFDSAGASTAFAQKFAVAPAPVAVPANAALQRVLDAFAKAPPVYTCKHAQDSAASKFELVPREDNTGFLKALEELRCEDQTVDAGSLSVSGCLTPIRTVSQIPEAERGILTQMLNIAKVSYTDEVAGKAGPAAKLIEKGLNVSHAFLSRLPVLVNGVKLSPQHRGVIVVFPTVKRIASSDATTSVGGIKIDAPTRFSLSTEPRKSDGKIPIGTGFNRLPGGLAVLAGFGLAGDVSVTLTPANGATPAGAEINAHLKLPDFLELIPDVSGQGDVTFRVNTAGNLVLSNMKIGPIDAAIGPVGIRGLVISYTGATQEWRGEGELCAALACLDAREKPGEAPPGGVVIRDGELQRIYANLTFPDPGIALFPGVQLNRIGAGFGLNPSRLLGGARVTAVGIFEIDGALALAFPTTAQPFTLRREEVGQAFPAELYNYKYTTFTLAIGADAYLKIPLIDTRMRLGGAYLLYKAPGYVAFGGGIDFDFFDIVSISGHADGQFNAENGRFNLGLHARVCVVDIICAGADANVSDVGVGGCVNVDLFVGDVNIGGGVVYNPFDVVIWPFDGCRWTRFADRNVFGASAAQSGGPMRVTVKEGDPSLAVQLDGTDGAPRVRVTTPDGKTFESTQGPGVGGIDAIRILRSEQLKRTIVGLKDPKPGTYTIEKLAGSPAITKTTEAEDPGAAEAEASVSEPSPAAAASTTAKAAAVAAAGTRRTLSYNIRSRPGQRVTFVEVGLGARRVIGTARGGRGKLTFTPAPGRDRRRIEAQFSLAGLRAETLTIARFTPPSPVLGRPARVRVTRRGGTLQVSWPRVAGATRYDVVVTTASGRQSSRHTARRRSGCPASPAAAVERSPSGQLRRSVRDLRAACATAQTRGARRRASCRSRSCDERAASPAQDPAAVARGADGRDGGPGRGTRSVQLRTHGLFLVRRSRVAGDR